MEGSQCDKGEKCAGHNSHEYDECQEGSSPRDPPAPPSRVWFNPNQVVSPPGQQSKLHAEATFRAISHVTSASLPHREVPESSFPFCLLHTSPGFHPPSKASGQQSLPASSLALEPQFFCASPGSACRMYPHVSGYQPLLASGLPTQLRALLSQPCTHCFPASRFSDENAIVI